MRTLLPACLVIALGSTAFAQGARDTERAQDGLTPTDVLPVGRFAADVRLAATLGQGTLDFAGVDQVDGDIRNFTLLLGVAAGLGGGFEIEALLPYAFTAELEIEEDDVTFSEESKGVGDLALGANLRLTEDTGTSPNFMIGAFVVLPTGDDDPAEPEIDLPGVLFDSPGEEGGIGSGAFGYGFQAGLSKDFSGAEGYFLIRYLINGTSDVDDVETDNADILSFLLGVEIHAGDEVTIDLRAVVDFAGEEVAEADDGSEVTEEAYFSYGLEARLYASLGSNLAFVVGITGRALEDHAIAEEADFVLEDTFVYGAEIGLHLVLGR